MGHIINITDNRYLVERTKEKPAGIWDGERSHARVYEKTEGKTIASYLNTNYREKYNIQVRFRKSW